MAIAETEPAFKDTAEEPNLEPDLHMYTAAELARLVVASYRFSQGWPELQANIFMYLTARYGERFDPKTFDEAQDLVVKVAQRITGNPKLHKQLLPLDLVL